MLPIHTMMTMLPAAPYNGVYGSSAIPEEVATGALVLTVPSLYALLSHRIRQT